MGMKRVRALTGEQMHDCPEEDGGAAGADAEAGETVGADADAEAGGAAEADETGIRKRHITAETREDNRINKQIGNFR